MHFKHILLASGLAFLSSPVVAQSGLNNIGSSLGPIEGGTLLVKRLEKDARRDSVKRSAAANDQTSNGNEAGVTESPDINERSFNVGNLVDEVLGKSSSSSAQPTGTPSPRIAKKGLGMLDGLLGEVVPGLGSSSSSAAASATPAPSPTPYDPFIKREPMPTAAYDEDSQPTEAASPQLANRQLGALSGLLEGIEGGGGSSSAAGSSTPVQSATPSSTPSETPPPMYSFIKRQRADDSSPTPSPSSSPMGAVKEHLDVRDVIPGYESSGSGSGFDASNGDGQDAGFSSDSQKESVDPYSQPGFFEKRKIPGYESSDSASGADFSNGDGQNAGFSSDSSKNSISDPFSEPAFFDKRQFPAELPGYESSDSASGTDFSNGDGQDAGFSSGSAHEAANFPAAPGF